MKKVVFIKNAVVLTVTTLILRFAGVIFKVWLGRTVGSESIGLYQIILSVYALASAFATSGISTAVVSIVAKEIAVNNPFFAKKAVIKGVFYTILLSFCTFVLLFWGANFIALKFIGDTRAALALKIIAVGVVFVGLCSCFRGYFIARRKAGASSFSQIAEQTARILLSVFLITRFYNRGVTFTVAAMVVGDIGAEALSALIVWICYKKDVKKLNPVKLGTKNNLNRQILNIALPITAGRYLSSSLRTVENAAVPRLLTLGALSSSASLSFFGAIKGMALPLLLFPSSFLGAVSLLLIPELSELKAKKQGKSISRAITLIFKITAVFGIIFGCIFWFCGQNLGILLYNDSSVGFCVKILAPLVPLMYLDSICDGLLKGLDCQKSTFYYSVFDSLLRLVLVFLFVPKYSVYGFIFIMYLSNILTTVLNAKKLLTVTKTKLNILKFVVWPLVVGLGVCSGINLILNKITPQNTIWVVLLIVFSVVFYFLILLATGFIKKDNLKNIIR